MKPAPLLLLLAFATQAQAQSRFPAHTTIQLRIGGMYATPLAKDEVATSTVDDSIPATRSHGITVQQKVSPVATLSFRFPMRRFTQIEASASVAHSSLRGDDQLTTWDAGSVTAGTVVIGLGYLYRNSVAVRGGVGVTKLFAPQRGLFTSGNSIRPLLEAGASTALHVGGRAIDLDARVQSHSFGTATLRNNGGSDGNVLRAIVQLGTTLWGSK